MRALLSSVSLLGSVALSAPAEAGSAPVATTTPAPVTSKPAKPAKPAKLVKPASVTVAKPAKPAKPVAANSPEAAAKPSANITRTAATVARGACNFGGVVSDRDSAYIRFYAGLAKRLSGGRVTVSDIVNSGHARNPHYSGSAKPHDAGVIQRLGKAGILNVAADGSSFTFAKAALTRADYVAG